MLRCVDNSIYTGITTDVKRRMNEHFNPCNKTARYTRTHKPLKLEAVWQTYTKSNALKLEYRIKQLSKVHKENLINNGNLGVIGDKIITEEYTKFTI